MAETEVETATVQSLTWAEAAATVNLTKIENLHITNFYAYEVRTKTL